MDNRYKGLKLESRSGYEKKQEHVAKTTGTKRAMYA